MLEAWRWFFRSFGPYAMGIGVGIVFAYLLTLFASGTKVPTSYEQWLALAKEASEAVHSLQEVQPAALAVKESPKPVAPSAAKPVAPVKVEAPVAPVVKTEPPAVKTPPPVAKVEPVKAVTPPPAPVVVKEPAPVVAATAPPAPFAAKAPAPVAAKAAPAVEKAPQPAPQPEKKEATKENNSQDGVLSCGAPPRQPGNEMNQYLACRWKENCLNRLAQARYMIEQGKLRCPTVGYDAQACQAYYQSLEDRYQPAMCEH